MSDPVILSLDDNTYERNAITDWLVEHRNSPATQEKMLLNQKISALLKPNKAIREAIEEFKEESPEFFPQYSAKLN